MTDGQGRPRVVSSLRRRTRWKTGNLLAGVEAGPWDVILWRNSAMYLEQPASDAIFGRLADSLAPGGYLVVGKAERPPGGVGLADAGRCVFVKQGA